MTVLIFVGGNDRMRGSRVPFGNNGLSMPGRAFPESKQVAELRTYKAAVSSSTSHNDTLLQLRKIRRIEEESARWEAEAATRRREENAALSLAVASGDKEREMAEEIDTMMSLLKTDAQNAKHTGGGGGGGGGGREEEGQLQGRPGTAPRTGFTRSRSARWTSSTRACASGACGPKWRATGRTRQSG